MALLPEECGGAILERRATRSWIVIDPRLSPVEQRCRLAHELVHLDRGSSMRCRWSPRTWDTVVAREEMRVDEAVADWLVPDNELWVLVDDMMATDQDITTRLIAGEFEVSRAIARIALDRHARRRGLLVA